jgi:methionyl-tRNA formyltransferase
MRLAFLGTPPFAATVLAAIAEAGHEIAAVYSQPPAPRGRGQALQPSAVQALAERLGIPVRTPVSMRDPDEIAAFRALNLDAALVVAFGQILVREVLEAPRLGAFNLHGSILPRWRGAAPIQRAVMAGDRETGVMVMHMEEGLDTGPVCLAERVPIGPEDTAGSLHGRLATLGADLMARAVAALEKGALVCTPQDETGVTYATKIDKAETRIDWTQPAAEVLNRIRGLSPFPGAWTEFALPGGRERVKVLAAQAAEGAGEPGTILRPESLTVACGSGAVRLTELQRAGKKPAEAGEFVRGARIGAGAVLA